MKELLREGAAALGEELSEPQLEALVGHAELLLKWNRSINLTAITDPREVVEKHLVDSLAVAQRVPSGRLLDAGTGGGFPGLPVRVVRSDVEVVLVDSVQKKVAFVKAALAALQLPKARALHLRLAGEPEREGLGLFDAAVSRAFAAPRDWLALAVRYLRPGGSALCLLGARDEAPGQVGDLRLEGRWEFELPWSKARRQVLRYQVVPRGTEAAPKADAGPSRG